MEPKLAEAAIKTEPDEPEPIVGSMGCRRFNFGTPWGPLGPGSFQGHRAGPAGPAGPAGRPAIDENPKNDFKMKDSRPGTSKNYVRGFNESF